MTGTAAPSPAPPGRIVGRKTVLVPFGERHLRDPAYLGWLHDAEVVRTLNLPHYLERPVSIDDVAEYCRRLMRSERDLFFALHLAAGDFIGTVKAGHIDRYAGTSDIGIMIGRRDLWGQGLATDAITALALHLFEEQGLRKLTAGAMATNPAMIRVFDRLGFRREGVLRAQDRLGDEYIDHILLGCLRDEFVAFAASRETKE